MNARMVCACVRACMHARVHACTHARAHTCVAIVCQELHASLLQHCGCVPPAEWRFPVHDGVIGAQKECGDLSNAHSLMTLHMYHTLVAVLEKVLLKTPDELRTGIKKVLAYSMRFEFQSRGTIHVHIVACL